MTGVVGGARGPEGTRAVLFDLDGVLVDSYDAWFAVVNETARGFGLPEVSAATFRATFGQGLDADVRNLYAGRPRREVEVAYERGMRAQAQTIRVNPEGLPALTALRAAGVRTACVTNTQDGLAQAVLDAAGLRTGFDVVAATRVGLREKPAPDLLHAALAALGVPARAACMVGDSRYDAEAAAAAGVAYVRYDLREGGSLRATLRAATGVG